MIFEMRTYPLKPGTVPQAEQAFADKIAERVKLSPLAGFWRTEVGTLNQIIHIWPYKDINERNEIRAKAVEKKVWPPAIADFVLDMESKILYPAPFSPQLRAGRARQHLRVPHLHLRRRRGSQGDGHLEQAHRRAHQASRR